MKHLHAKYLHAPSRRELLLASGTLFAWAYLPKLARAEDRDPRFLAFILRGAGAQARRFLRAQSGDAEPASHVLKGLLKDHLRADERTLAESVFPGSESVAPMAGLVG